ncbi:uncharacterized protein PHALS_10163 [Plasmopara halstedii]|uniref:Uncharacterized protein n=1 Tax=Plasmopara halstedii TaxID=4781 RepID=A0A0P1AGM5_PLAHL|nr:uncharacterized protein PHALS_10163 [Plasmopara halstedii]CEG39937.1 hypothetical protein PHALS_10163 [Plasmopara halstedii]|eukprot:XP_024576306.1 hypothetical protein PHALS_10163 [Plasmopara halstedii]
MDLYPTLEMSLNEALNREHKKLVRTTFVSSASSVTNPEAVFTSQYMYVFAFVKAFLQDLLSF